MNNGKGTVTVRVESKLRYRIKGVCVHAAPNRHCSDHLTSVRVQDHHDLIVAAGEKPSVIQVNGQATRLLTRGHLPAGHDLHLSRIDYQFLCLVFQVHVEPPSSICHGKFGPSTQS